VLVLVIVIVIVIVIVFVIVRLNSSGMYFKRKSIETEEQTVRRNSHIFNIDYDYEHEHEHEREHDGVETWHTETARTGIWMRLLCIVSLDLFLRVKVYLMRGFRGM
jgi:ABC-type bacteriocin/lantibiotic exporter with double-glycine peptidase domain